MKFRIDGDLFYVLFFKESTLRKCHSLITKSFHYCTPALTVGHGLTALRSDVVLQPISFLGKGFTSLHSDLALQPKTEVNICFFFLDEGTGEGHLDTRRLVGAFKIQALKYKHYCAHCILFLTETIHRQACYPP